jgi:hypothetical protein
MSLVKSSDDEKRVLLHMDNWYGLLCAYFNELYNSTIARETSQAAIEAPTVAVRNAAVI